MGRQSKPQADRTANVAVRQTRFRERMRLAALNALSNEVESVAKQLADVSIHNDGVSSHEEIEKRAEDKNG